MGKACNRLGADRTGDAFDVAVFILGRGKDSVKARRFNAGLLVFCNVDGDSGHGTECSGVKGVSREERGSGDDSGNLSDELR
jgi:hypothetical protein